MSRFLSNPSYPSSGRVVAPQSKEGVKSKRTSLDADMRDHKVWESLRSPIQHCNHCGAPMQALCVCPSSDEIAAAKASGETIEQPTFGYNNDIDQRRRERIKRRDAKNHSDHWMQVLSVVNEVLALPTPDERVARILKAPVALRASIAQATNTEW